MLKLLHNLFSKIVIVAFIAVFVSNLVYYLLFIENCEKLMDAAKKFASIGCRTACIQSVSIAISYHITATMQWMQA